MSEGIQAVNDFKTSWSDVGANIKEINGNGSPVREYRTILQDSGNPGYINRLLIGIPSIGMKRDEWIQARYGQIIPTNWSMVEMMQFMSAYMPIRYQVADAQNLIVREAIEKDFEWPLVETLSTN